MLAEVTFCCLFTAVRSDSGTSASSKPASPPELPYTVRPPASRATSSTPNRSLLAICPAVCCNSSCVGCSGSAPARFCISCAKSRSTASWARVSTASRLSQYAMPDADTAAVSATSPKTTTSLSRRLVRRSRRNRTPLRAADQARGPPGRSSVTEAGPAGSPRPARYGSASGKDGTSSTLARSRCTQASTSRESPR
ncbi:hypothetical protein SFUMM280S_03445 [Streptomyces fumanus]